MILGILVVFFPTSGNAVERPAADLDTAECPGVELHEASAWDLTKLEPSATTLCLRDSLGARIRSAEQDLRVDNASTTTEELDLAENLMCRAESKLLWSNGCTSS